MGLRKKSNPPRWAFKLFRWYCRADRFEELSGDLEEMYDIRRAEGKGLKADLFYIWNVLRCCKSYARKTDYSMDTTGALLKSYFKLSWRHMLKNKGSIALNIFGLGFALAFSIVAYMMFGYNREFDDIYRANDDVYRIHAVRSGESSLNKYELTPLALENALKNDYSGVEHVISYLRANINLGKDKYYFPSKLAFASPSFLKVFDLPLKYGSKKNFDLHGIYLTDECAQKLFGDISPVGERLSLYYFGRKMNDVKVLGVFKKIPSNSTFGFEGLLNLETLVNLFELDRNSWESEGFHFGQYVQLSSSNSKDDLEKFMQNYIPLQNEANSSQKIESLELASFCEPNVVSKNFISYNKLRIDTTEFLIFCIMTTLILFIACFNLANTNVGLIAGRIKEIGIRKTIGSSNRQIFVQFILETLIVMTLAFVFALSFTNIISEHILGMVGQRFLLQDLSMTGIIFFVVLFLFMITLLTGLIPALYARKFEPVTILNHKLSLKGLGPLHYFLAIAQYSLSIAILLVGLSFMQNAEYMQNVDFGYNTENLMVIRVKDGEEFSKLKNELSDKPFSKKIFGSYHYLGGYSSRSNLTIDEITSEVRKYKVYGDFLTTMGVEFNIGRDFIVDSQNDITDHIIVNQYFVDQHLTGDPIHQKIIIDHKSRIIVGVVKDYQHEELYAGYAPQSLVFTAVPDSERDHLFLRTNGESQQEVFLAVEEIWGELLGRPMVYHWQNEYAYTGAVESSQQIRNIFLWLSAIAFALSLISIMAMANLHVNRRIKEISIRKILGANPRQILAYINRPFTYILSFSLLFGLGIGHTISDLILTSIYIVHIEVSLVQGLLIGLGIVLLALTMIIVSIQPPLRSNPTDGLRTE